MSPYTQMFRAPREDKEQTKLSSRQMTTFIRLAAFHQPWPFFRSERGAGPYHLSRARRPSRRVPVRASEHRGVRLHADAAHVLVQAVCLGAALVLVIERVANRLALFRDLRAPRKAGPLAFTFPLAPLARGGKARSMCGSRNRRCLLLLLPGLSLRLPLWRLRGGPLALLLDPPEGSGELP